MKLNNFASILDAVVYMKIYMTSKQLRKIRNWLQGGRVFKNAKVIVLFFHSFEYFLRKLHIKSNQNIFHVISYKMNFKFNTKFLRIFFVIFRHFAFVLGENGHHIKIFCIWNTN